MDVPVQSKGTVRMTLTPEKSEIILRYTFRVKGSEREIQEEVKVVLQNYQAGDVIIKSTSLGPVQVPVLA